MTRRYFRFAATLACTVAATGFLLASRPASAEVTLHIGDKAPALDIEHYVHDPKDGLGKVTDFEKDKIYVVEFWATWCGPCIASMPHLAELQNQYRGEGVQIISISDEDVETVDELMAKDYPEKDQTFGELTSAYTITTDPDASVSTDYMLAAGQNGIPCAFLVGKTGLVEWIGHPMEMDEPLAEVVAGTWDREAYKEQMKQEQQMLAAMQKINQLARAGKFDDAIKVVDKVLEEIKGDSPKSEMIREQLTNFRYNLRLDAGDMSDEVISFFRKQIADAKGDARAVTQFGFGLMSSMQQGTDPGPLAAETIAALEADVDKADDQIKPLMYLCIAQISASMSDFDKAIAAQTQAIELSEGTQKERMQQMLDEIKEMANEPADEDAKADDAKAAK
ncbi:TlpA disulfide reductase family protein [Allorhodopirellula heiligendammensis]|uniref:Thiol-disulfide oxidoreductase ResA n=1 Tax=Allorhodopirellula heiligendammensis TaxID=2714739 RepID=A0A5C6BED0_9BACT|nr:TlpA disulfide reductase family protein [Allorhodopirellula heiligendammensis]TWU10483.1 Thiol-disulfide oxidoreductase ResA [Allorhodopirellula heiligendammensis]|tara:strand:- start:862 stop:2040 length:1179 start_codon:yes stop_codon:yes gene_type:complete